MTKPLSEETLRARAKCRLACGRSTNFKDTPPPKPQKGKKKVDVGNCSASGRTCLTWKQLPKKEKDKLLASGIKNKSDYVKDPLPTDYYLGTMGEQKLSDILKGKTVRHYRFGEISLKKSKGETLTKEQSDKLRKDIQRELQRRIDNEKAKDDAYNKRVAEETAQRIATRKAYEDKKKGELMRLMKEGTERQKKASIIQLNKKFGGNFTYTKPVRKNAKKPAPVKPKAKAKPKAKKVTKPKAKAKPKAQPKENIKMEVKPAPKKRGRPKKQNIQDRLDEAEGKKKGKKGNTQTKKGRLNEAEGKKYEKKETKEIKKRGRPKGAKNKVKKI